MNCNDFYPVCVTFQPQLMFRGFSLVSCQPVMQISQQCCHVQALFTGFLVENFCKVQDVGEDALAVFKTQHS